MLTHPFENLLLRAKACNKETCCRKLHALYNTVSSEMNVMVINLTINQICFEREIQIKYGLLFLYAIGIPYFSNSSYFSTFQNTTDYQNLNPKGQYAIRQQTDFITGVSLETGPALPCSFWRSLEILKVCHYQYNSFSLVISKNLSFSLIETSFHSAVQIHHFHVQYQCHVYRSIPMIYRLIVNPHNDKLWDGVIVAQYMIGRSLHQHQRGQGSKPIHPTIFQNLLINYCI